MANLALQLLDDFNVPKRLFNTFIDSRVNKKISLQQQKALLENAEAKRTVAHSIYYNIERYQNWYQAYWDENPIHRNPKFSGLKEFYNMYTDTKIAANTNQRQDTLINRQWHTPPAIENNELELTKAEFARQALLLIPDLSKAKKGITSDMIYGYSVSEKELGFRDITFTITHKISKKKTQTLTKTIKDALVITRIRNITPTAFTFNGKRQMFYASAWGVEPVLIKPEAQIKFIRSTFDDKFGSPYGWPLFTSIFPHWIMKKAILAWRLIFLEKFGMPTVIGDMPEGTDPKSEVAIEFGKSLDAIMHSAHIKKPKDFDIKYLQDANKSGTMDMFQNAINYIDQSISEILLGHKQATEATSVGSLASSTVKEAALRQAILETDAMNLDTTMAEQVVKFLIDANFPSNGLYPDHYTFVTDDKDVELVIKRLDAGSKYGLKLSETQIRRELHLDYPLGEFDEVDPEEAQRVLKYIGKGGDTSTQKTNGEDVEEKEEMATA